jgi:hypothetical protein
MGKNPVILGKGRLRSERSLPATSAPRQGLTRKSPAGGGIAAKDPAPEKPGRRPKENRHASLMGGNARFSGRKNQHFKKELQALRRPYGSPETDVFLRQYRLAHQPEVDHRHGRHILPAIACNALKVAAFVVHFSDL